MTLLDYLASMGGNPEWSLSYLIWQQESNKGGDAVGDDKGKTESVPEQ